MIFNIGSNSYDLWRNCCLNTLFLQELKKNCYVPQSGGYQKYDLNPIIEYENDYDDQYIISLILSK